MKLCQNGTLKLWSSYQIHTLILPLFPILLNDYLLFVLIFNSAHTYPDMTRKFHHAYLTFLEYFYLNEYYCWTARRIDSKHLNVWKSKLQALTSFSSLYHLNKEWKDYICPHINTGWRRIVPISHLNYLVFLLVVVALLGQ